MKFSLILFLSGMLLMLPAGASTVIFGFNDETYAGVNQPFYYQNGITDVTDAAAYINIGYKDKDQGDQLGRDLTLYNEQKSATAVDTGGTVTGISVNVTTDWSIYAEGTYKNEGISIVDAASSRGYLACNKGAAMIITVSGLQVGGVYNLTGVFAGNAGSVAHRLGMITGYVGDYSHVGTWSSVSGATAPALDQATGNVTNLVSAYRKDFASGVSWDNLVADENGQISFYYSTGSKSATNRAGFGYLALEQVIPEPVSSTMILGSMAFLLIRRRRN